MSELKRIREILKRNCRLRVKTNRDTAVADAHFGIAEGMTSCKLNTEELR